LSDSLLHQTLPTMDTSAGAEAAMAYLSRMILRLPENINGGVKISKVKFRDQPGKQAIAGISTASRVDAISTGFHSVANLDF
jgi:hypothetical protein